MSDNWDPVITPQEGPEPNAPAVGQPENPPEAGTAPTQIAHPEYSAGQYGQYEPPTSATEYPTIGEPVPVTPQQPYAPGFQPPYAQVPPVYPPVQPPQGQPPYPPVQPPQGQPPQGQSPYPPVQPPYPGQPVPGGYPPVQAAYQPPQGGYPPAQQGYPGYVPQQPYPPQMLGQAPAYQTPVVTEKGSKTGVIVGVVIAVVVLALVGVGIWWMAGSSSNSTSSGPVASRPANPTYNPSSSASSSASPTAPSSTVAPSSAGQSTVTVDVEGYGPVDYTVTGSAELMDKVGSFYSPDEGNIFVSVPITVTYRGDENMFFFDIEDTALLTVDGVSHDPDLTAVILNETPDTYGQPFSIAILEPGESTSGTLIFQVDSTATAGALLQVGVTTDNPQMISIGL